MASAFVSTGAFALKSSRSAAVSKRSASNVRMMAEMSRSVPFLPKPANTEGPGNVDFDPLGFSDYYNIKFLREAELKHGRICMLAALGWVFPEIWHIPSPDGVFSKTNPLNAIRTIPTFGLIQIVLLVFALEAISWKKVYNGASGGLEKPGDFGFDPLNLRSPRMELAEVKNGRLAMIAVGGFIHQALLTNQGALEQLKTGSFQPTAFPLN
mmetsp:Transcript_13806/g.37058  ORF Transcript_13806/g.37058 Transcript_13806/m.37058 type:complete len:211 (-) Transcript_13806:193-825(-)